NVASVGGIDALFAPLGQDAFDKLAQDTLYYAKLDGKLTDDDIRTVHDEVRKLTTKLPLALEKEQLKPLSSLEQVRTSALGDDFSLFLKNEAGRLLLTEKPGATGTVVALASGRTIALPT